MRNLATLLFSDAMQKSLHQLHSEVRTGVGAPPVPDAESYRSTMASLDLAVNELNTACERLQERAQLVEIETPPQLLKDDRLVVLHEDHVRSFLQMLYEDVNAKCNHVPQPDPAKYFSNNEDDCIGVRMVFFNPAIACDRNRWNKAVAHSSSVIAKHVGLLLSIGFQYTARNFSVQSAQALLDLIARLNPTRQKHLYTVKDALEKIPGASNPRVAFDAAYKAFSNWHQEVLNSPDMPRCYLPPDLALLRPTAPIGRLQESSRPQQVIDSTQINHPSRIGHSSQYCLAPLLNLLPVPRLASAPSLPPLDSLLPRTIAPAVTSVPLLASLPPLTMPLLAVPTPASAAPRTSVPARPSLNVLTASATAQAGHARQGATAWAAEFKRQNGPALPQPSSLQPPSVPSPFVPSPFVPSPSVPSPSVQPAAEASRKPLVAVTTQAEKPQAEKPQAKKPTGTRIATTGPNLKRNKTKSTSIRAGVIVPKNIKVTTGSVVDSIEIGNDTNIGVPCTISGNFACKSKVKVNASCTFHNDVMLGCRVQINSPVTFLEKAQVRVWNLPLGTPHLRAGGSFRVDAGVTIGYGVEVGTEIYAHEGATIHDGVILGNYVEIQPGISVGANAKIADKLLVHNDVPANAVVQARSTTLNGRVIDHCATPIPEFKLSKASLKLLRAPSGAAEVNTAGKNLKRLAADADLESPGTVKRQRTQAEDQPLPVEPTPMQVVPVQAVPMQVVPMQVIPVQVIPVQCVTVQAMPGQVLQERAPRNVIQIPPIAQAQAPTRQAMQGLAYTPLTPKPYAGSL